MTVLWIIYTHSLQVKKQSTVIIYKGNTQKLIICEQKPLEIRILKHQLQRHQNHQPSRDKLKGTWCRASTQKPVRRDSELSSGGLQGKGARTSRLWVRGLSAVKSQIPSGQRRRVHMCVDRSTWIRDTLRYWKFWPEQTGRKQKQKGNYIGKEEVEQTVHRRHPGQKHWRRHRRNVSTNKYSKAIGHKTNTEKPAAFLHTHNELSEGEIKERNPFTMG